MRVIIKFPLLHVYNHYNVNVDRPIKYVGVAYMFLKIAPPPLSNLLLLMVLIIAYIFTDGM